MTDKDTSDVWWKNAICYSLDVATYADWDGDGCGDLRGLTDRLGYLRSLGVGCLWLLPVHPSPRKDGGYDVADHYAVDPRIGTLGDFVEMVRTAHHLGIRVLLDLVVSHTSDEHPWFRAARRSRDAPLRDYYIWAPERPADWHDPVFPGEQDSTWSQDEATGEWYFHHYHDFQPDLNVANPLVRDEINKIIAFWLELGIDGFRIDSLPFIIDKPGVEDSTDDPHTYLRHIRDFLTRRHGDAILFGEANLPKQEQRAFFGDPDVPHDDSEANLLFDFRIQAAVWLALATGEAEPIVRALRQRPAIPETCAYANFPRHHDELTFEFVLTDAEADQVRAAFDPDGEGDAYGRGLRRRLINLLGGDHDRARLAMSLTMALPGMPGLLYGDEIGLADDLSLPGRSSIRVPMRWKPDPDGAPSGSLWPDAESDADHLRDAIRRIIHVRRDCTELGYGEVEVLDVDTPAIFALAATWRGRRVVVAHNLGAAVARTRLELGDDVRVLHQHRAEVGNDELCLEPSGYVWLRSVFGEHHGG